MVLPNHVFPGRELAFGLENASPKYVQTVGAKPRGLGTREAYGVREAHPMILAGVTFSYGAASDFYFRMSHTDFQS